MKHKIEEKKEEKKVDSELKEKSEDYKETLQRLQAEFENFKKRSEKEIIEFRKYAVAELIKSQLPILDSFELALKSTQDKDKFVKGVELIYAQLHSSLSNCGLREIKAEGQQFDPYKHEVLLQEESEKDNVVLEELQKGYMFNDVVLRHTKVKLGKKARKETSKEENKNGNK